MSDLGRMLGDAVTAFGNWLGRPDWDRRNESAQRDAQTHLARDLVRMQTSGRQLIDQTAQITHDAGGEPSEATVGRAAAVLPRQARTVWLHALFILADFKDMAVSFGNRVYDLAASYGPPTALGVVGGVGIALLASATLPVALALACLGGLCGYLIGHIRGQNWRFFG